MSKIQNNPVILWIYFALAVTTLLVFVQVGKFDFLNYDDLKYVSENNYVNSGFTRAGLLWAFKDSISYWHPLTWLSHMLDCQLFGLNPGPHHLVNLGLHIANTLLLFTVLWQMTSAYWRSAFVAALFALHPLHIEPVAWIVARKDVLSTLFSLLTIIAYLQYLEKQRLTRYLLAIVFFVLGLTAKPTVVTLPFVLLLLDYWPLGRFDSFCSKALTAEGSQLQRKLQAWKHLIKEKIPFFVLSFISVYMSSGSTRRLGTAIPTKVVPMGLRIANAIVSYVKYLYKLIWPDGLAPFYPYPDSIPLWQNITAMCLIICLFVFMIYKRKTKPYFLVGGLWFFGTLLPSIGLIQAGQWPAIADRFTYVPSIGFFIIIAWAGYDLLKNYRYYALALTLPALAILLAMSISTFLQLRYWQNTLTLFEHALKTTKNNYVAHSALAYALYAQGRNEEAMAHDYEALRIEPDYTVSHVNLGNALAKKDRFDQAEQHFIHALDIDPRLATAYNGLGELYRLQGKTDLALSNYRKAIQINPHLAETYGNLGILFAQQGNVNEAIDNYRQAIKLGLHKANVYNYLAYALSSQGRITQAAENFAKALKINPDFADAHYGLGTALLELGQYPQAMTHFQEAVRINPNHAMACYSLGLEYVRVNMLDKAAVCFKNATALKPDLSIAHYNLAITLRQQGKTEEAVQEFTETLRTDPNNAVVHNDLGVLLARMGKINEAIGHFNEALRIKPDFIQAKQNLNTVLSRPRMESDNK
jgi:tetratricopeptide (TPR) repeat protein